MNDPIFASMREQMRPSEAAQAALRVRLEGIPQKKGGYPLKKYLAAAACAALVLCAYPAYRALTPKPPVLHSFTTVDGSDPAAMKSRLQETIDLGGRKGSGDRDRAMLPEEVVEAMEEAGFSTADIDAYQALGYEMTWANWWKYIHSTEVHDLESLKTFSAQELSVNTGVLDDPVEDLPAQPGADGYQLLMDHFGDTLPDWYGGAYLDDRGALMVLLVDGRDPGDKSLELEVMDAVGNIPVGFTSARYSRSELSRMNSELLRVLDGSGIFSSFGIYDDQNRIILDVWEPLPDDVLAAIAEIDPDDDAILIRVVEERTAITDEWVKGPVLIGEPAQPGGVTQPHSGSAHREEGEEPALSSTVPDNEDLIAVEPQIEDLPESKAAHYDLLPLE